MALDPATYVCQEHQADLTPLVQEALEDEGPPVAYKRGPQRARPFEVTVTCPGAGDSGPHLLVCTGTRTR